MFLTLDTKIEQLKKVGPAYLKKLQKLKIYTVRDLFFHFPHRYDDFSQIIPINQLKIGQTVTVQGKVADIKTIRTFKRRMGLTEAVIEDNSGMIRAVWFNQPYLIQSLSKGTMVSLSGKITSRAKISNPAYEIIRRKELTHTGRLVPIYHETSGLSSRYLRYLIKPLLYLTKQFEEFIPFNIRKEFDLMDLDKAIKQIHFPENIDYAEKARQRLAFDELFLIQLTILKQKQKLLKEKSTQINFNQKLIKSFVEKLPFKLTNDQRISAWEIIQDLDKTRPMNRLLNGDVGSGKTVVAAIAALSAADQGYQTALMAPTEILAKQHFQTFRELLKKKFRIGLLTSSETMVNDRKISKSIFKKQVLQGKIDIAIGTHAIIQKDISFKKMVLAIVDEQHRFGVLQRAALQKRIYQIEDGLTTIPHLLSMTATPIPRTLSLTVYGDLDISLLKQMPKNRQKIITKIISPSERKKTYDFIRKQIKQKRQAFVICPLIDESEKLEVKSVTQEYERLSKEIFPDLKIAMLHGKLKEKEQIMKDFKEKKTDILISTSVIEVGIDVPNATVMVIEGPERFGLAQLHQFRGRIGRGTHQSYCFLFTQSGAKKTNQRLNALLDCKDGFELAEKDLQIRGPGDFSGSRQWGLPDLTMASLNDLELIKKARKAASLAVSLPNLDKKIKEFQKIIHLE